MRKKNYKGRCEKRVLNKYPSICKLYDPLQNAFADILDAQKDIQTIKCNVFLGNLEVGEYTTDFVCTLTNGDLMVRECVQRSHLSKPLTAKLLDASREYWLKHGVTDWGIVTNEKE